jgi:hypothetical protein
LNVARADGEPQQDATVTFPWDRERTEPRKFGPTAGIPQHQQTGVNRVSREGLLCQDVGMGDTGPSTFASGHKRKREEGAREALKDDAQDVKIDLEIDPLRNKRDVSALLQLLPPPPSATWAQGGQTRRQRRKPSPSQELPQEQWRRQLQAEPAVELRGEMSVPITPEQIAPALYTDPLASAAAKQPYPAVLEEAKATGAPPLVSEYTITCGNKEEEEEEEVVVVEAEEEANQGPTVPGAQRTNSSNLISALKVSILKPVLATAPETKGVAAPVVTGEEEGFCIGETPKYKTL